MDSQKQYFKKLSSNLISYLYFFFPPKEIIYISQINSMFYKALSNDFIWESFAKTEELFMPSEKESFSRWKDYFVYLNKLKENLKSGKASLSFKMTPYRGHKSIITAVLPIPMSNGPYSVILSGDEKGNVYTWNLDEDDDYEKEVVCETGSSIVDIRLYNKDKVVFWNKNNEFYFYEVNVQHYENKSKINKNSERFRLINHFPITLNSNVKVREFQFDREFTSIYVCSNFHIENDFKDSHYIKVYSLNTGKVIKLYEMDYNANTKGKVKESKLQRDFAPEFVYFQTSQRFFAMNSNFLYTFSNYDLKNFEPLYKQKNMFPNGFAFNMRYGIRYQFMIDLLYIYGVFILTHNGNICFLGVNTLKNKSNVLFLLQYKHESNELKYVKRLVLSIITSNFDFLNYNDNVMNFLIEKKTILSIDALKFSLKKTIYLFDKNKNNNESQIDILTYACDKYRFVVGTSGYLIKVFNIQTGEMWYNLLGGSMTVIPKSFIGYPYCTNFHIIKLTRWSIVGVLGNLIREYSFKPIIKE